MVEASSALQFGFLAFSSLFSIINPISAAPVFVGMTESMSKAERRRAAFRATFAATTILLVFSVAGGAIFKFFNITVPAFQITGGILFALMSIRTLDHGNDNVPENAVTPPDPSIVPIGIPLIAGPGAISTVMVLVGQTEHGGHRLALAAALAASLAATLLVLLIAPFLTARLGATGQKVTNKVMGLLTAVIGIQFVINGLTAVAVQILRASRGQLS